MRSVKHSRRDWFSRLAAAATSLIALPRIVSHRRSTAAHNPRAPRESRPAITAFHYDELGRIVSVIDGA